MKRLSISFKLCCVVATAVITSCSSGMTDSKVLDETIKKDAKPLVLEEVQLADKLEMAKNCFVYDSILVVQNYSNSNKYLLDFVSLNTLQTVESVIMRGNGPGELIEVIIKNSGEYLLIDGFMNKKFAKIDVMDYLNKKDKSIKYSDYSFNCQSLDYFDEDKFVVVNPYRFINKHLKIEQDEPRFLLVEGDTDITNNELISALNVNNGGIMINYNKKLIAYYSKDTPLVEFFDFNLNPITTVTGPDELNPDYSVTPSGISYQMDIPSAYITSCYNKSDIYLVYEGRIMNTMDLIMNGGTSAPIDNYIFKLDWNGNFKESYVVKGKTIYSISVTSKDELYISCMESGLIKLYKAKL